MANGKLMTPLFYDHSFNRKGRKMRAAFEREISDGTVTFRLWRRAGKPEIGRSYIENDQYILYVEANNYLFPLGMTDFFLISHCGFDDAVKKLYGDEDGRRQYFNALRDSEDNTKIPAALEVEKQEIERFGCNPACQTKYIQTILENRIGAYLKAKENGGKTFPDFIGALILGDLSSCVALSEVYKAQQQEKERAHAEHLAKREEIFCMEKNGPANQLVSEAIQIIQNGGVLKNETITFYQSQYDYRTYSIVNYLMRLYHVDVPLRTQGWINEKLFSATIKDGQCEHLQYFKKKKYLHSEKFFECMNQLIRAVAKQTPDYVRR